MTDQAGQEVDDFLFCTSMAVSDGEIVQRYYDRWGVEEAIQEPSNIWDSRPRKA